MGYRECDGPHELARCEASCLVRCEFRRRERLEPRARNAICELIAQIASATLFASYMKRERDRDRESEREIERAIDREREIERERENREREKEI